MAELSGSMVLITGASSGFGEACAHAFAGEGARLVLAARRRDRLETLAEELRSRYGSDVFLLGLDVRDRAAVEEQLGSLPDEWRGIDVLVNNAGLSRGLDKLHEGSIQDWEEMIDTNVKGLLYVSRTVIPWMVARKRGTVINIGSIAGHEVYPKGNVYCATKHAVAALTRGMRQDLLGTGVRVCSVDPGLAETEFSIVRFRGDAARARTVYDGLQPLNGEDVAQAVLFCASQPAHVQVAELILLPSAQASSTLVHRGE